MYEKVLRLNTGGERLSAQVINFSNNDMERLFEACISCVFITGLSQVGLSDSWADDSRSSTSTTTPAAGGSGSKGDLAAAFYNDHDEDDDDPQTSQDHHKKPNGDTLGMMAAMCEDGDVDDDHNNDSATPSFDRIKRVHIKLEQAELDQEAELDQADGCSDSEMQLNDHHHTQFLTEEEVVIHHEPLEMERADGEEGRLILLGLAEGEASQDFAHPGPSHHQLPQTSSPSQSTTLPPPSPPNLRRTTPIRPTGPRRPRKYSKQDLMV